MRRVPPARDEASPLELTVTSTLWPGLPKAGSSEVTITEATFFTFTPVVGMLMPWRAMRLARLWMVNLDWMVSPVPLRPTTRP